MRYKYVYTEGLKPCDFRFCFMGSSRSDLDPIFFYGFGDGFFVGFNQKWQMKGD